MSSSRWGASLIVLAVLTGLLSGCASQERGVEASVPSAYPSAPAAYLLGVGDELRIMFPADHSLDYETPVTPSGTVTVPSGKEIVAIGLTTAQLTTSIEEAMEGYLRDPAASVILQMVASKPIFVIGEVKTPGVVDTPWTLSVSMALSEAGGLEPSGKPSSVMVIRHFGVDEPTAFRVDVSKVLSGRDLSQDFVLQAYDVVYVPKSVIGQVDEFVHLFFDQIAPAQLFYLRGYDIVKNKGSSSYR